MRVELDISRLKKSVQRTRDALALMQEKNEKCTKQFITEATDNLNYIARSAIDKFYEDYEPNSYDRTFDLYNTYKIKVTADDWTIDFDSDFMEGMHRVDNQDPEYIFENSFIRGWHGGAISGAGHPNPGTPYWRFPDVIMQTRDYGTFLTFSENSPWFSPSLKSPSPYKEIVRKSNLYMKLETAKYHAEINENLEKFRRQMIWNLERIR